MSTREQLPSEASAVADETPNLAPELAPGKSVEHYPAFSEQGDVSVSAPQTDEQLATFTPLQGDTASEILQNIPAADLQAIYDALLRNARNRLQPTSNLDPMDMVQRTFLAFMAKEKAIAGHVHTTLGLAKYLMQIQQNKIVDYYRKSARTPEFPTENISSSAVEDQDLEHVENHLALEGVVQAIIRRGRLSQTKQALLRAIVFADDGGKGVAAELGMQPNSLRTGRSRLKTAIAEFLPEVMQEVLGYTISPGDLAGRSHHHNKRVF